MNKTLFPVAAAAILMLTTSCGEDTLGTSFEVTNANHDESVNPAHIRGYHLEPPAMAGAPFRPNQYYPFSTRTLPADVSQQLEGNIAVRMVMTYYSPNSSLRDLAEEFNPSGQMGNTPNSPADTGGGGGGSTGGGNSGNGNSGNGNGSGNPGTGTSESGNAGGNNSGSTEANGRESGNDQN